MSLPQKSASSVSHTGKVKMYKCKSLPRNKNCTSRGLHVPLEGEESLCNLIKYICQASLPGTSITDYSQIALISHCSSLKSTFWKLTYLVLELIIICICCESWISRPFRKQNPGPQLFTDGKLKWWGITTAKTNIIARKPGWRPKQKLSEATSEITGRARISNDMKSLEGWGDFSLNLACFL